jgi:soluble P-type ATPase
MTYYLNKGTGEFGKPRLTLGTPVEGQEGSSDVLGELADRWVDIWIDSSDRSSCAMVKCIHQSSTLLKRDIPR